MTKNYSINNIKIKKENILFTFIAIFLSLVAGLRPISISRDDLGYVELLGKLENFNLVIIEPTFKVIGYMSQYEARYTFLIYAFLAVFIKITAIRRLSSFPLATIFAYVCLYFILHEMTQIRVGVAVGIFLLSIKDIYEKNFVSFLVKVSIATLFHYSMVVVFFAYFLNVKSINKPIYYLLPLVAISSALISKDINIISYLLSFISQVGPSFLVYKIDSILLSISSGASLGEINIFNYKNASFVFLYYLILYNISLIRNKYFILLFKLFSISIVSFYLLSPIPVLAFRVSNIFGISLIIIFPYIVQLFKEKIIIKPILFIYLIVSFIIYGVLGLLN